MTNDIRDLDVFFENVASYSEQLSDEQIEILTKSITPYKKQWDKEYKKLQKFLQSAKFSKTVQIFSTIFEEKKYTLLSLEPANIKASHELLKIYEKILLKASLIDKNSSALEYHSLRIAFKKFRYLLELFESVYDEAIFEEMMSRLKTIQKILGLHQDRAIQIKLLQNLHENKKNGVLESYLEHLQKEQQELKVAFKEAKNAILDESYKSELLLSF